MNVVKNEDGTVDIQFRAGTSVPISVSLNYGGTATPFELGGKVEFVVYNEASGRNHFVVPAVIDGNKAAFTIPPKLTQYRSFNTRYSLVCTREDGFVFDIIKGRLLVEM